MIEEAEKPIRDSECLGLSFQEARTKFKCKKFIGKYKEYGSTSGSAVEREGKAAITEHLIKLNTQVGNRVLKPCYQSKVHVPDILNEHIERFID